jgi:hypothetical protein
MKRVIRLTERDLTKIVKRIINETDEPKKKLFIPRKIDEREEQLKGEIKKFLTSIKDSIVWEYLSFIYCSLDLQTGDRYWSVKDLNGKSHTNSTGSIESLIMGDYGAKKGLGLVETFKKDFSEIIRFMLVQLNTDGGDEVIYKTSNIKNLGNNHLEFGSTINTYFGDNKKIIEISI